MVEQMGLPGFDPPARSSSGSQRKPPRGRPAYNLFFALLPEADVAAHLAAWAQQFAIEHALPGTLQTAERLHVSIHGVYAGALPPPDDVIARASRAAASVAYAPFDVVFDHVLRFGDETPASRACVLGVHDRESQDALRRFHQILGMALADESLPVDRNFTPHMTLLYTQRPVEERPIAPLRWPARAFTLVLSHVGKTHYELRGNWPLRLSLT